MIRPIKIETDVLPASVGHRSHDFTSLLATRQINRPLFSEDPATGQVKGDLVSCVQRLSSCRWRLELREDAVWNDGTPITSADVLSQFRSISMKSPFRFLLKPIQLVAAPAPQILEITTRFSIELPELLSNPMFGPENDRVGISSGGYVQEKSANGSMRLRSNNDSPDIELILAPDAESGQKLYDTGQTDITCSTTYPLSRWMNKSMDNDLLIDNLNISVDMKLPSSLHSECASAISSAIDRSQIATELDHLVEPLPLATSMWSLASSTLSSQDRRIDHKVVGQLRGDFKLYYPNFSPNKEIAELFAKQVNILFGMNLALHPQSYDNYLLSPSKEKDSFQMLLRASPWPNRISMLVPYLFSKKSSEHYINKAERLVLESLSQNDQSISHQLLEKAALTLEPGLRMFSLVRLRSVTRSRFKNLVFPPSGWTDYAMAGKNIDLK